MILMLVLKSIIGIHPTAYNTNYTGGSHLISDLLVVNHFRLGELDLSNGVIVIERRLHCRQEHAGEVVRVQVNVLEQS